MSAYGNGSFWSARALLERFNRTPVRACLRATVSFPVGAAVGAISDLSDPDSNRLLDLGIAGAAVALVLLLLRWFGQGNILAGLKLAVVSYVFWQAILCALQTVWVAAGMDGPPDLSFVAFSAAFSAALFIPTSIMLRRLDPDF